MVRRVCIFCILLVLLMPVMTVFAEEETQVPEEYENMLDSLPDDIADMLPDEIFSDNISDVVKGAQEITSWSYIFDTVFEILGLNIESLFKAIATLTALLVLCSVLNTLKNSIKNSATEHTVNLVSSATMVVAVLQISQEPLKRGMLLLEQIQAFTNIASPVMCSMYAMGGNITSAFVHNYGLIVFLSIVENICIISLEAILGICMGLTLASSFVGERNLLPLSNAVKKAFTFFVGMIMLVFTTVISTQTLLSSKADTLSTKTAKMLATQIIPLVGGTIGETLRTAGASVEYLRSNVGVILIIVLLLIVLPTFISIALYRLGFIITNAIAGLLGCEKEGKMLIEISSIYGYVLAIISMSAVALLLLITAFAKCSSPLM